MFKSTLNCVFVLLLVQNSLQKSNGKDQVVIKNSVELLRRLDSSNDVHIVNKYNGRCLQVNPKLSGRERVNIVDCEPHNEAQLFDIIQQSDGQFTISNPLVDPLFGNGCTRRGFVEEQRWVVESVTGQWFRIRNAANDNCLDYLRDGYPRICGVAQTECDDSLSSQLFKFDGARIIEENVTIKGLILNTYTKKKIPAYYLKNKEMKIVLTADDGSTYIASIDPYPSEYTVTVPTGHYKVKVSLELYFTDNYEWNIESNSEKDILLTKIFHGWIFVLTWGKLPKDLDAYLSIPSGEQIGYDKMASNDGQIRLESSSYRGYGPEVISAYRIDKGKYHFYVLNYSREVPWDESEAKVEIYKNNEYKSTIHINAPGAKIDEKYWDVCVVDARTNEIDVINKVSSNRP